MTRQHQRPSMRFVPVKSEAQQAAAMVFRGRDLLVRQRTQVSNALRSHMAEYGWIAPKGLAHLDKLAALIADPSAVPEGVRSVCTVLLDNLALLDRQIGVLDREIARRAREDEVARRLITIPGIGPITSTAPVCELPYGLAAHIAAARGRTDGSIRLRAKTSSKYRLRLAGRPQMESGH